MVQFNALVSRTPAAASVPHGVPLIAALTGFMDTGNAVQQFIDHLQNSVQMETVLHFDLDELYDYRARRPLITFDQDHLSDYQPPQLKLSVATDDAGAQFLLLHGVEPDFRWNAFADVIEDVVRDWQVSLFTWVHSIPMPSPHTRPIQVTVSGNRPDLAERFSLWRPRTQVPSNVLHLLEYRLIQRDLDCVGFVLLVPHYIGDNDYPDAAVKALECVSAATGLLLPTDELREEGRAFARQLAEQMEQNDDLRQLIDSLEHRHDVFLSGSDVQLPHPDSFEVPDGEELAAEWERFLANRPQTEDPNQLS